MNLNTFFNSNEKVEGTSNGNGCVAPNATDDCSTTDSGSAMEEDNWSCGLGTTTSSTLNGTDETTFDEDQDEGIDISSSTDQRNIRPSKNEPAGPYIYELFAIMIHSGSASGGHYYAYIKELDNNEWFCFNDQTVSPVS